MKKILLLTALISCLSEYVFCQGESIEGKIIDDKNKPLPYATVRLKNASVGVISNLNGDFRFPLREQFLQDTIIVSYIGYVTIKVPVARLRTEGSDIKMSQSLTMLSEVEIHSKRKARLTAKKIVAAGISNIKINYPNYPFTYVAYYRDYQIKENNYTNLNEAIVRVADNGFNTTDQGHTKIELLEYKANSMFPIDSSTTIPYDNIEKKFIPHAELTAFGGNELSILRMHDALRNYSRYSYSFVNILKKDFIRNHLFTLTRTITLDDIQLYEVTFKSKQLPGLDFYYSKGVIYVEHGNYKIHKLEYSMHDSSQGGKMMYNIKVEYRPLGDKMYLNYISFNNEFNVRHHDDFRVLDVKVLSDRTGFVVQFSHQADSATATNKNNYTFTIFGKKVALDAVALSSKKGTGVIAYLKDPSDYVSMSGAELAAQTTAQCANIKDRQGRMLDVATFLLATQYREIFVQKIEPNSNADFVGIDKFTPLKRATATSDPRDFGNYWMNTPLKTKLE